jgi:hypothetical protein
VHYDVARGTIIVAERKLADDGLVEIVPGSPDRPGRISR